MWLGNLQRKCRYILLALLTKGACKQLQSPGFEIDPRPLSSASVTPYLSLSLFTCIWKNCKRKKIIYEKSTRAEISLRQTDCSWLTHCMDPHLATLWLLCLASLITALCLPVTSHNSPVTFIDLCCYELGMSRSGFYGPDPDPIPLPLIICLYIVWLDA